MPFTNGVFANVAGATNAVAGQIIQSLVWNNIHSDYSTALNMLMGQLINTPSQRNLAWMNGGFEVWQRGAGGSASIALAASTVAYTADRWYLATDTNEASTVSAQAGLVDESNLCARVQRNAAQTGLGVMRFAYPLDTDEIIAMRGNLLTLSFRARSGASFSPTSGTLEIDLYVGTGAVAKRNATPYTNETNPINASVNLTTSTALIAASSSVVIPTTTTQAEIQLSWTPVGVAGASDYFEIDDLQLEAQLSPNTWTPTSYDRLDFPSMLAGCKRHYQKSYLYTVAPAAGGGLENAITVRTTASLALGMFWVLAPELRTDPSVLMYNPTTATSSAWLGVGSSSLITASIIATQVNTKGVFVFMSTLNGQAGSYSIHLDADAGI
jgi:hypothetical protein